MKDPSGREGGEARNFLFRLDLMSIWYCFAWTSFFKTPCMIIIVFERSWDNCLLHEIYPPVNKVLPRGFNCLKRYSLSIYVLHSSLTCMFTLWLILHDEHYIYNFSTFARFLLRFPVKPRPRLFHQSPDATSLPPIRPSPPLHILPPRSLPTAQPSTPSPQPP